MNISILFAPEDKEDRDFLVKVLEAAGHRCFNYGTNPEKYDVLAIVATRHFEEVMQQHTWEPFFAYDPASKEKRIKVFEYGPIQLRGVLAPLITTKLYGLSTHGKYHAILNAFKEGRNKPETPLTFPAGPKSPSERYIHWLLNPDEFE